MRSKIKFCHEMIEIYLEDESIPILIDCGDLPLFASSHWSIDRSKGGRTFYVSTNMVFPDGRKGTNSLHRLIMNPQKGKEIDHLNGNGLDNRRANLRICTHQQNRMNSPKPIRKKLSSSRFKGVYFCRRDSKWCTQIRINKKTKNLGRYNTEIEAANVYNNAAIQIYGEYARLNIL